MIKQKEPAKQDDQLSLFVRSTFTLRNSSSMGNKVSREATFHRLSNAIPPYSGMIVGTEDEWTLQGKKAFVDYHHRQQFIQSLMIILTEHGMRDLSTHSFSLLHLRQADGSISVALVAMRSDVVEAKIESLVHGKDRTDAFCKFVQDVEKRLADVLSQVPSFPASKVSAIRLIITTL